MRNESKRLSRRAAMRLAGVAAAGAAAWLDLTYSHDIDLIMMSTHRYRPFRRPLLVRCSVVKCKVDQRIVFWEVTW